MLTFLSVAFSIYGAMHLYALSKLWLALPHSFWMSTALAIAGLLMTVSPLLLYQISKQNWQETAFAMSWVVYLWMGFLFLFCCTALLYDISHVLVTLAGRKWPLNEAMGLLTIALFTLSIFSYGLNEAKQIKIEEVTITTPKLASGKITIAQISDLHLGVMLSEEFIERVMAKLEKLDPDIVVATGDIVDGQGDHLHKLAKRLHSFQPPYGKFAVTGNHEYFAGLEYSLRFLHDAGFTMLRGESATVGGITLLGVDDQTAQALGQEVMLDIKPPLNASSQKDFTVLLKHQPVVESETPFDLQLSGHVHGGQIFPFGFLTQLSYGVHTGLSQLAAGRLLYVSRGTGSWGPPLRLFAAPEITLITIKSEYN